MLHIIDFFIAARLDLLTWSILLEWLQALLCVMLQLLLKAMLEAVLKNCSNTWAMLSHAMVLNTLGAIL